MRVLTGSTRTEQAERPSRTNRLLYGGAALAAAAVLCLGGAGSSASWLTAADTAQASFALGELGLVPGEAVWMSGGAVVDGGFRPVPGSSLTYTQQFAVAFGGDGLQARVTLNPGAVSAGTFVVGTPTLTGPVSATGTPGEWMVTGAGTITLVMPFAWPKGTEADDTSQGASITIESSELLIVQEVDS